MNPKSAIALLAGATFVTTTNLHLYQHANEHLHLPPGNAPISANVASTATVTMSTIIWPTFNASIDAEYTVPADTTLLKSDGQVEKA